MNPADPSADETASPPPAREPEACLRSFRECFNSGRFYQAHDVLEALWLPVRHTAEGELWKGLIQLAAAFVHVQRRRPGPALSLLRAARARLQQAAPDHPLVDRPGAIALAHSWEGKIAGMSEADLPALLAEDPPRLAPPGRS